MKPFSFFIVAGGAALALAFISDKSGRDFNFGMVFAYALSAFAVWLTA